MTDLDVRSALEKPLNTNAIRLRPRSMITLTLVSIVCLASLSWPLVLQASPGTGHDTDAHWVFIAIVPILLIILLVELSEGGIDTKAIAMLAVLSGVGAVLRPMGAGTGGIEPMFGLLILSGRVFGAGFGFVLGNTAMFASAILTGGVGPWLPFQMIVAGWLAMGAGLLPNWRGGLELALLLGYTVISCLLYGLLMDLWFWPLLIGQESQLAYQPEASILTNLHHFSIYVLATSLGFDLGRVITNCLLIAILGPAVLFSLRRVLRGANFEPATRFPSTQRGI